MQMALGLILIYLLRGANIIADNNKSVFILLRRLSAWQFPHLLLSAVLRAPCLAWRSPLLLAGHSAANPRPSLLSIDGTDRRTLDRSYTVLRILCGNVKLLQCWQQKATSLLPTNEYGWKYRPRAGYSHNRAMDREMFPQINPFFGPPSNRPIRGSFGPAESTP